MLKLKLYSTGERTYPTLYKPHVMVTDNVKYVVPATGMLHKHVLEFSIHMTFFSNELLNLSGEQVRSSAKILGDTLYKDVREIADRLMMAIRGNDKDSAEALCSELIMATHDIKIENAAYFEKRTA